MFFFFFFFFFSSRRRHTRSLCDWSSDVCSSDLRDHDGVYRQYGRHRCRDVRRAPHRGDAARVRGEAPRSPKGDLAAATQGMLDRIDHRRLVLTALARTLASACASDGPVGPLSLVPLTSELHNAPQQTTLAGVTLQLETYLWRDYQPIAPPDGEPLIAVLRAKSVDGASIPAALQADAAWIINGDLVSSTP